MMRPAALLLFLMAVALPALAGPAAPGFRVKVLDRPQPLDSRDLIGKKVLVVRFQSSYCKACGRQSAAFARLVDRYRARGVEFVAVHVQDTVPNVRSFMRTHQVTYPVGLDPKLTIARPFGFKGTPYTVVVDRTGEMVARIHGEQALSRLPRILDESLSSGPRKRD